MAVSEPLMIIDICRALEISDETWYDSTHGNAADAIIFYTSVLSRIDAKNYYSSWYFRDNIREYLFEKLDEATERRFQPQLDRMSKKEETA